MNDDDELIDIPMESDESLHELTGVGMAPVSDIHVYAKYGGDWHSIKRVQGNCVQESILVRGLSVFSRASPRTFVRSNIP